MQAQENAEQQAGDQTEEQTDATEAETDAASAAAGEAGESSAQTADSSEEAQATEAEAQPAPAAGALNRAAETATSALEHQIDRFVPFKEQPLLQVGTLVIASLIFAKLVEWFLKAIVHRWAKRTDTDLDDHLLTALTPPVFVSVLAVGLNLATRRLGLSDGAEEVVSDSLATLAILVWLIAVLQISGLFWRTLAASRDRFDFVKPSTAPLFDNLAKIILFLAAAYIILSTWGGNLSGLLAAGGIVGIAVGFAARDTLANLFAGIFIFADSPYKIGDFINLDSGERGVVTEIGIRSTRLLTRDDVEITIPNAVIANAKIVNESGGPHVKYRVRVQVGVAYGSDVDQVRSVLMQIAEDSQYVCPSPEPRVRFRRFGGSALDFELLVWVEEPVYRGRALDSLNVTVYKRFNEEGIEIPYSKHDLYIKEMPGT